MARSSREKFSLLCPLTPASGCLVHRNHPSCGPSSIRGTPRAMTRPDQTRNRDRPSRQHARQQTRPGPRLHPRPVAKAPPHLRPQQGRTQHPPGRTGPHRRRRGEGQPSGCPQGKAKPNHNAVRPLVLGKPSTESHRFPGASRRRRQQVRG